MENDKYLESLHNKCKEIEDRVSNGEVISFVERMKPWSDLYHYLMTESGTYIDENGNIQYLEYGSKKKG